MAHRFTNADHAVDLLTSLSPECKSLDLQNSCVHKVLETMGVKTFRFVLNESFNVHQV